MALQVKEISDASSQLDDEFAKDDGAEAWRRCASMLHGSRLAEAREADARVRQGLLDIMLERNR